MEKIIKFINKHYYTILFACLIFHIIGLVFLIFLKINR
jgi:hypothetical protein